MQKCWVARVPRQHVQVADDAGIFETAFAELAGRFVLCKNGSFVRRAFASFLSHRTAASQLTRSSIQRCSSIWTRTARRTRDSRTHVGLPYRLGIVRSGQIGFFRRLLILHPGNRFTCLFSSNIVHLDNPRLNVKPFKPEFFHHARAGQ